MQLEVERVFREEWGRAVGILTRVLDDLELAAGDVEGGLTLLDDIEGLDGYHLLHAARADLYRRLGRHDEAATCYRRALELTTNEAESRFLERRLAEVS